MNETASSNNEHLIPELDRDFLKEKAYDFTIIPENGALLLVIRAFSFPVAYTPTTANLLIVIPAGYPNAQLDMFWTQPDVKLASGAFPAAANNYGNYAGQKWQRWSRHSQVPWRPGIDNLRTFFAALKKELEKGI